MITVVTPATSRLLTTLERVLIELGDPPNPPEDYLNAKIADVSDAISAYCKRDFGVTEVTETFRQCDAVPELILSRWPVIEITDIDEAGTALSDGDWEIANGVLRRLSSDIGIWWARGKIEVTYTFGWVLPGQEDEEEDIVRDLPFDIEAAAVEQIRAEMSSRYRDPLLRTDTVDGLGSQSYAIGSAGMSSSLLPSVQRRLDPYVIYRVG